jgi:hypothetical protein
LAHARRRAVLAGLAGAAAASAAGVARAALPETATLIVPGPEDGAPAKTGSRFAAALSPGGAPRHAALRPPRMQVTRLGGADGVTAANRFATTAAPDGRTLLVLAGASVHARLVGDTRAHFDPAAWLPVCALAQPSALIVRQQRPLRLPLRVAAPTPGAPETAALLVLDLLGIPAVPVFGLAGATAEAALAQGMVDLIVAGGPDPAGRAAALGAAPWLAVDADAAGGREPALPGVPSVGERVAALGDVPPALPAAAAAGLAATRLCATIVLPSLTPADRVALWRHAALRWRDGERVAQGGAAIAGAAAVSGAAPASHALVGAEAAAAYATLCAPPEDAVQAYRGWLVRRLDWRAA